MEHKPSLHDCVISRNLALMMSMLDNGADINVRDEGGSAPFHVAARELYQEGLEMLLERGAEVNFLQDGDGNTALHEGVGNVKIVKALLDKGASPEHCNSYLKSPLHYAVRKGNMPVVKLLLSVAANINVGDNYDVTPLHEAVYNGYLEITKLLIDNGAEIGAKAVGGSTPLHIVTRSHELSICAGLNVGTNVSISNQQRDCVHALDKSLVKGKSDTEVKEVTLQLQTLDCKRHSMAQLLLDSGANPHIKDDRGLTPLHHAANNLSKFIVQLQLDSGADLKIADSLGSTPVNINVNMLSQSIAQLLLNSGADRNIKCTYVETYLQGTSQLVDLLFNYRANSDAVDDNDGDSPLFMATHSNRDSVVQLLLAAGADPNVINKDGDSPLHVATRNNRDSVVQLLLAASADPNVINKDGDSPLQLAVINGSQSNVKLLLDAGVDCNAMHKSGESPLHLAWRNKDQLIVKIMLDSGADPNFRNIYGNTLLHMAVHNDDFKTVEELIIKRKVDVGVKNKDGNSPLHLACKSEIVSLLVDAGANVNDKNEKGDTPLRIAVNNNIQSIIKLLLDAGADPNIKCTYYSKSYLHCTYQRSSRLAECVQILFRGDDVCDVKGETPLHMASRKNRFSVVQMLLAAGADPNVINEDSYSPLLLAYRCELTVKLLLDSGADPGVKNINGNSPLHFARKSEIVSLLVDAGANINDKNKEGGTPLHRAALCCDYKLVATFLKLGAKVDAKCKLGNTPLHVAVKSVFNNLELIETLLDWGASVDVVNNNRETPLTVAKGRQRDTLVKHSQKLLSILLINNGSFDVKESSSWQLAPYLEELKQIKERKIGNDSLFHIFSKSIKPHFIHNKLIETEISRLKETFPIYGSLLCATYQKEKLRYELMNEIQENFIVGIVPIEMRRQILIYLTVEDLENLKEAIEYQK